MKKWEEEKAESVRKAKELLAIQKVEEEKKEEE